MDKNIAYRCNSPYEFEFICNLYYNKGVKKEYSWHKYFLEQSENHNIYIKVDMKNKIMIFFTNYYIEPIINAKHFIRKLKIHKLYEIY